MARPFFRRRKSCPFSGKEAPVIDYKDVRLLQGFVSERGDRGDRGDRGPRRDDRGDRGDRGERGDRPADRESGRAPRAEQEA